jgi:hypothetical protein
VACHSHHRHAGNDRDDPTVTRRYDQRGDDGRAMTVIPDGEVTRNPAPVVAFIFLVGGAMLVR